MTFENVRTVGVDGALCLWFSFFPPLFAWFSFFPFCTVGSVVPLIWFFLLAQSVFMGSVVALIFHGIGKTFSKVNIPWLYRVNVPGLLRWLLFFFNFSRKQPDLDTGPLRVPFFFGHDHDEWRLFSSCPVWPGKFFYFFIFCFFFRWWLCWLAPFQCWSCFGQESTCARAHTHTHTYTHTYVHSYIHVHAWHTYIPI